MVAVPSIFHHLLNIRFKKARPQSFRSNKLYSIEKRCADSAHISDTASIPADGGPQPDVGWAAVTSPESSDLSAVDDLAFEGGNTRFDAGAPACADFGLC